MRQTTLRLPIVGSCRAPARAGLPDAAGPIVRRPIRTSEPIVFGLGGNADVYLFGLGWHSAETHHRWTSSGASLLAFDPAFDGPAILRVDVTLMDERAWSDYDLAVTLNGRTLQVERDEAENQVSAPLLGLNEGGEANILAFHSRLARICDLVGGSDTRQVGIGLRRLWFERDAPR